MNKTVSCLLYGGLGNQLFQIFTTIAYALDNNRTFTFKYTTNLGARPTYWNSIFNPLQKYLNYGDFHGYVQIDEPQLGNNYENIQHILLNGYFQNPAYFNHLKPQIMSIMKLNADPFLPMEGSVSMHFRRGDYKQLQDCHPILSTDYYVNALDYLSTIDRIHCVQYFCEDEDHDDIKIVIEQISAYFPRIKFARYRAYADWKEMLAMTACNHNIIANSSFSWWGAYLNPNPNKIVCYPATWFGPAIVQNVDAMFPRDWIKI